MRALTDTVTGGGTPDDPWNLRTPPGTSDYQMYRADSIDPPELVCQVGSTKLRYLARCLDDVPAMHLGLVELEHNPRNNRRHGAGLSNRRGKERVALPEFDGHGRIIGASARWRARNSSSQPPLQ